MKLSAGWTVSLCIFLGSTAYANAATQCRSVAGKLASAQGSVELLHETSSEWQPGELNETLCEGDTVRVGARSRAALMLVNDAVLRLDQNTTMRLVDIAAEKSERSLLELVKGALQSFSRKPRLISINTPYLNGSIEGTEFIFRVENESTQLTVYEGTVVASNDQGKLAVPGGASVSAAKGQAPIQQLVVKPRDGVQWALYYPPLPLSDNGAASANERELAEASPLLDVGRADDAMRHIEIVLRNEPENAAALSLQAIILLVQNEPARALDLAQKAAQADPKSAIAAIALSYAQQAAFDLNAARQTLLSAVENNPNNALVWTRLAEIHASFGELNESLAAAQHATTLAPELARAQTVQGFSHLVRIETAEATAAFDKAIQLDQADPLPHLGKGLALIRTGELIEGRREIEIAAGLDGNNALIRSYLGKAYFEEKRDVISAGQYATAKKLDAHDPTPYFYDAILKQTTNRPVEALQDMQQAITLNDNRAVYRSRLLLDADLAARSASLARVYSDLGFEDLALVEGWKSVNTDPSNFSAHRFLADSYAAQPRHEIARVSELLQSQLLQPLNSTPIQPRLGESNLFLIAASGPSNLSFNEFNPLFSRDGVSVQGSAMSGSNATNSEEVVASSINGAYSASFGISHFETEGWRDNADQSDDIANVFVQKELSSKASVQAEYRYRHTEYGDLLLRFFPDEFFPGQKNDVERHALRIGGRYDLAPDSTLLASVQYQHSDTSQIDRQYPQDFVSLVDLQLPENAYALEMQHLLRKSDFKLTSGVGYFHVDGGLDSTIGLDFPPPPDGPGAFEVTGSTLTQVRHVNAYTYANIDVLKNLIVTLGASADDVYGDFPGDDKQRINPKFGVVWNPLESTTVRTAAFKTLKRTLVTNQTLEPTQVAGFNQFFDDYNLTEVKNYGVAIDQKFSEAVFGGVEYTKRDLSVPYLDFNFDPAVSKSADWNESNSRAYLFWTPLQMLALSAQYQYEYTERDPLFPEGLLELTTHRIPLEIKVFAPFGLSASLRGSYVRQRGDFALISGDLSSGEDSFWLIDASLSYRLPNRLGFISVGATNLTDEGFKYFDRDLNNASIQPNRMLFARVTLAFP